MPAPSGAVGTAVDLSSLGFGSSALSTPAHGGADRTADTTVVSPKFGDLEYVTPFVDNGPSLLPPGPASERDVPKVPAPSQFQANLSGLASQVHIGEYDTVRPSRYSVSSCSVCTLLCAHSSPTAVCAVAVSRSVCQPAGVCVVTPPFRSLSQAFATALNWADLSLVTWLAYQAVIRESPAKIVPALSAPVQLCLIQQVRAYLGMYPSNAVIDPRLCVSLPCDSVRVAHARHR
jgi:hypothetical protein